MILFLSKPFKDFPHQTLYRYLFESQIKCIMCTIMNTNQLRNRIAIFKVSLIYIGLFLPFLSYSSHVLNNQTRTNIKSILKLNGAIWCVQSFLPSLEIPLQRVHCSVKALTTLCYNYCLQSGSVTRQSFRGSQCIQLQILRSDRMSDT